MPEIMGNSTHQDVKQERIRPLQILTGSSTRLLRIMAEFAVTPSLQNLTGKSEFTD